MSEFRFQIWVLAARPKTLWAAAAPVLIGTAMAFEGGAFAPLPALAALFGAIMIQIGTNFANDYFDYRKGADSPGRLGPLRVTQAGLVEPGRMKIATIVAFSFAVLVGIYLVSRGGWPIVVIGIASIMFGILYTAGPYPLGYHGLGEIFVLVFFGPVAVGGTYYVQALRVEATTLLLTGLAPGLFSVAILTVNNLRDIDSDQAVGKRTLAARFGHSFARWQYLAAIVVGSGIPALLFLRDGQHPCAMATFIVPIIAIPALRKVFTSRDGPVLNSVLTATGKFLLLYSVIFSVGWLI